MPRTPQLRVLTGNRLELLADRLADGLRADPLPPDRGEVVVVPSRGMRSWLTRHLARRWGIAASVDWTFPDSFVDRLAGRFGPGPAAAADAFRPAAQLFELHDLFREFQSGPPETIDMQPVTEHLRDDPDGRKRYQLARRVSQLFASYQFARPEEVARWMSGGWFDGEAPGPGEKWQRALFTQLAARHAPAEPPAHRILDLVRRLGRGDFDEDGLPERVAVFGASSVPPMVTQVFAALARHRPVDFYLLTPTAGYLGDLRSRRERERDEDRIDLGPTEELVGELGRLGREFFGVLLDLDAEGGAIEDAGFASPGSGSVLHHLQSTLLDPETPPAKFDASDRSLRLHSCHSPLREMEVLRDEVLAALSDGAAASVSDVMLLVPDIRVYAPFARSVFGGAIDNGDRTLRLPLRVADRTGAADQPFARVVLRWLDLAASRLTLSEVFDLLQEEVVRARFGFAEEDLDAMRDRLRDAGVVWGVDPAWRARLTGSPEFAGVSWREGMDRLLLGCFTGAVDGMVDGVLPAADATVGDVDTLGQLATALSRLFELLADLAGPHPMEDWADRLRGGILALTDAGDERHATQRAACTAVLERLVGDATGSTAPIGRLALRDLLDREFAAMDSGSGFASGMLTVAELRPMRSLPASVLVVAGLDADSFPRRDPRDGLDLAARHRRRGDRTPRDDDRQLFLELLLCARERLVLSFVGRSQKDGHERTLSPCVQELLDTLERLGFPEHTVPHSLQPFAVVKGEERTYDRAAVRAGAALSEPSPVGVFVDAPVEVEPPPPRERIALEDLRTFWTSPSRWFCTRALELTLVRDREEEEAEAFGLDRLRAWKVRDLGLRRGGMLPPQERLRPELGLPANPLVEFDTARIRQEFERVDWSHVEEGLEVEGADFVVDGVLRRRADGSVLEVVAGALGSRHRAGALVAHVFAGVAGIDAPTLVGPAGKPWETKAWQPLPEAEAVLARLVEGFRAGRTRPLHFFPRTSLEFAKQLAKQGGAALEIFASPAVRTQWSGKASRPGMSDGEAHDEAVALCTRGLEDAGVCNEEFIEWARDFQSWLEEAGKK